ncbi:hypothetical protein [Cytobacillus oceanisediminis]|uniref:hypothetical protein n=1 Tax=Cytobacillus oceanisediminis TaxID=665099 RepID=UPI003736FFB0
MILINQTQIDQLNSLLNDNQKYIETFLKIRTKEGKLVPFKLNSSQIRLLKKIEELQQQGKPVRIIIAKSRQMGFSTLTEGLIFKRTATNKLTNSLIIAHKETASSNLFNMSKLFYEEMPTPLRPMKKASNAKELIFENPTPDPDEKRNNPGLRSKIKIESANNEGAGRSETIHNLHVSELAFWNNPDNVMLGLMQAVPNTPNTMVIVESTSNGVGGTFYNMWKQAERGENDFIPMFFPWFEHTEYSMPTPDDFEITEEEEELQKLYNLTTDQLTWRRWAIRNNCGGDVDLFKQEYPSYAEESFLSSGRPRFSIGALKKWLNNAKKGEQGYLEKGSFIKDNKGYIEIWERPKPNHTYVIGADVSEGLADGDYSAATVWDSKTKTQVAKWHGHIDPDLFAGELENLGNYYNKALIAVESNNHGFTTLNILKRTYINLLEMEKYDENTDTTTKKLGWQTNKKTKPLVIDNLAYMIREKLIQTFDQSFINECMTYIREENGSTNAIQGNHDDLVMASAIALFVMSNFIDDYLEHFESHGVEIINNDEHLPFALQDDEDNKIQWYDL